jgi:hypothetical protein
MDFPTLIASVGVGLLLLAFFLNMFHFINENSTGYILLNIFGASISGYASYLISFTPFIILEGTWAAVAVAGMIRKFTR